MTALLPVLKCGCRRELCSHCRKPAGRLVWAIRCPRHADPWRSQTRADYTCCDKCAAKIRAERRGS